MLWKLRKVKGKKMGFFFSKNTSLGLSWFEASKFVNRSIFRLISTWKNNEKCKERKDFFQRTLFWVWLGLRLQNLLTEACTGRFQLETIMKSERIKGKKMGLLFIWACLGMGLKNLLREAYSGWCELETISLKGLN